jgi:hypothetical protein
MQKTFYIHDSIILEKSSIIKSILKKTSYSINKKKIE